MRAALLIRSMRSLLLAISLSSTNARAVPPAAALPTAWMEEALSEVLVIIGVGDNGESGVGIAPDAPAEALPGTCTFIIVFNLAKPLPIAAAAAIAPRIGDVGSGIGKN